MNQSVGFRPNSRGAPCTPRCPLYMVGLTHREGDGRGCRKVAAHVRAGRTRKATSRREDPIAARRLRRASGTEPYDAPATIHFARKRCQISAGMRGLARHVWQAGARRALEDGGRRDTFSHPCMTMPARGDALARGPDRPAGRALPTQVCRHKAADETRAEGRSRPWVFTSSATSSSPPRA